MVPWARHGDLLLLEADDAISGDASCAVVAVLPFAQAALARQAVGDHRAGTVPIRLDDPDPSTSAEQP